MTIGSIFSLAAFAVPALTSALTKGQMTGTLNNVRQFYIAGYQMALDGTANSDANLTWPGDDANAALTLQLYLAKLIQQSYLQAGDLTKLLTAPGHPCTVTSTTDPATGTVTVNYAAGTPAFKVYRVSDANAGNTIFAATLNYTYDTALPAATTPYSTKGFIIVRKAGDASIPRTNNATAPAGGEAAFQSLVGKRPGDPDGAAGVTAGDTSTTGVTVMPPS